jgi:hypothetical protein
MLSWGRFVSGQAFVAFVQRAHATLEEFDMWQAAFVGWPGAATYVSDWLYVFVVFDMWRAAFVGWPGAPMCLCMLCVYVMLDMWQAASHGWQGAAMSFDVGQLCSV